MPWQPVHTQLTINSKGTAIPIFATPVVTPSVIIQGNLGNTDDIFVGDSTVDGIASNPKGFKLAASEAMTIEEPDRGLNYIDLSTVFLDSNTNGSIAEITFLREI